MGELQEATCSMRCVELQNSAEPAIIQCGEQLPLVIRSRNSRKKNPSILKSYSVSCIIQHDTIHSPQVLRFDQTQSTNERTFLVQWALYFYYVTVLWAHRALQVQIFLWEYITTIVSFDVNKLQLLCM